MVGPSEIRHQLSSFSKGVFFMKQHLKKEGGRIFNIDKQTEKHSSLTSGATNWVHLRFSIYIDELVMFQLF